jgi:molybdate transport system substrate-binding protein
MTRKSSSIVSAAAAVITVGIALANARLACAAEVKLISSPGVRAAVGELVRRFEAGTGHRVAVEFEVFAVLKRKIDAGEAFDVAILSPALIDELIQARKIAADTRVTFGRTGMGLAVRKGGPRPDISSAEAFRQAMLDAKSVVYSREGGSGKIFLAALDRLGIAAEMRPKGKPVGLTLQAVVEGDAEFAFTGVGLILADPAVELVGSLPSELQTYVVFTMGANAAAKEPEAAGALIRFLAGPSAASALKDYGVEPGPSP